MSEPIRYTEVSNDWNGEAAGLAPSADGEWVKYDDYAALLAEVERLSELVNNPYRLSKGWRPIETAPKDKEVLLAYLGSEDLKIGQKMYKDDTKSDFLNQCWVLSSGNVCQPTHWMPIPKPPAV